MTDLDAVLRSYQASLHSQEIVGDLLTKSRKGAMWHGTIFFNLPLDEARRMLTQAKMEMDDLTIVSLMSVFERIIFDHPKSPLRKKSVRQRVKKLNVAISLFRRDISPRVYVDTELLCGYRNWVAHGKRWDKPAPALPVSTHARLVEFLKQASIG